MDLLICYLLFVVLFLKKQDCRRDIATWKILIHQENFFCFYFKLKPEKKLFDKWLIIKPTNKSFFQKWRKSRFLTFSIKNIFLPVCFLDKLSSFMIDFLSLVQIVHETQIKRFLGRFILKETIRTVLNQIKTWYYCFRSDISKFWKII